MYAEAILPGEPYLQWAPTSLTRSSSQDQGLGNLHDRTPDPHDIEPTVLPDRWSTAAYG